jgi:hypothetical protein
MLTQDKSVSEIRKNGIVLADRTSFFAKTPEELGFPRKRYEEYLALFSKAGLKSAVSADDRREFFFPLFRSPGGVLGVNLGIAVVWREDYRRIRLRVRMSIGTNLPGESGLTGTSRGNGIY